MIPIIGKSHLLLLGMAASLFSSCASIDNDPAGRLLKGQRDDLATYLGTRNDDGATILSQKYRLANESGSPKERNDLVWNLLHMIDTNYFVYEQRIQSSSSWFDFGSNTVNLGLTTASTLSGAEGVKTTLSALATVITGTHSEFNRSVLRDQAMSALVAKMRANRATKYADIRSRLKETTARYPVGEAMRDILEYYQYGTLEGTFGEITKSAAKQEQDADNDVEKIRSTGTTF